jgi:hypothetical protein
MNKFIVILFSTVVLISCNKSDNKNSDLIGKWKLKEVLSDPGDGSGSFHSVSSEKVIEFHSNGTVTSNGAICSMAIESNSASSGTYLLPDSTINSANCSTASKIKFHKKGSTLTLNYTCDEACAAKYTKE